MVVSWLSASPGKETIVLLHGGADTALSFQALVDNLPSSIEVFAPVLAAEHFFDNMRDLHRILLWCSPSRPAVLVGHSLGGVLATMYAGLEPSRVSLIVSLEGFLSKESFTASYQALKAWVEAAAALSDVRFPNFTALLRHISQKHPRVPLDYQLFLAHHCWGRTTADGDVKLSVNPVSVVPTQPSYDEFQSYARGIRSIAVLVMGELSAHQQHDVFATTLLVNGAGHGLHIEAPREVAVIVARQAALQRSRHRPRSQSSI